VLRGGWGDGRLPWVDARDVAEVAVRALTEPGHEGRAHALAGPEALSGAEVAERLSGALGRPVRYLDVAPEAVVAAMRARGVDPWVADAVGEVMHGARRA